MNTRISAASKFFELAVNDSAIARNPMDGITYRKRQDLTRMTPTREQFDSIVADLRSQFTSEHGAEDTADFVALSGLLGLGQAELSGIERKHINLDAGTIQVFRRKTRQSFTIPISPAARPIIERRARRQAFGSIYSPKTTVYHIEYRVRRLREKTQRERA